ncbi:MAG TPA: COX15/CtaA family protein [Streptosporangiaceae bacterium]|nr:COX15/CtaA family protein [Streptosporangiaceae bacterium]
MPALPASPVPTSPARTSSRPGWRRAWELISGPVLRPTPASLRGLALAAVVANVIIMSTGEAVRLSKSGLGCPDWPDCTSKSLVAASSAGQTTLNTWIEFGNRLLNFPLVAIAGLTFIAACCYRPPGSARRRRDLIWLAAALPGGVVGQAVVGGIVVLTKLNPAWVAIHFMLSTAIVAAAVVLHTRVQEGDGPAVPTVRRDLRIIGATLVGAVALTFAAGTVVTGTGPLAGNATAPRFHLPFIGATQFHADIGWVIAALSFALLIGLPLSGAPRRAVRRIYLMAGLTLAQGAIGYAQYFSGLPAGLVWVHVTVAVVIWAVTVRLYLAMRDRGPFPAVPPPAGKTAASTTGNAETPEELPTTAPAPGA